jgi:hypothetical protein
MLVAVAVVVEIWLELVEVLLALVAVELVVMELVVLALLEEVVLQILVVAVEVEEKGMPLVLVDQAL